MIIETPEFLGIPKFIGQDTIVPGAGTGIQEVSLFGSYVPTINTSDPTNYTLGTRIKILQNCTIVRLRFYRPAQDTVTTSRTLHIWDNPGTLIDTASTTEVVSTAGWVEAAITPIPATTGEIYVVSYNHASAASAYAAENGFFNTALESGGVLRGIADNEDTFRNGIYWDSNDTFPLGSFAASCYFADMVVEV